MVTKRNEEGGGPGEGGGGETRQTTFKRLRPEDVWHPKCGAPRGNRNALKHGRRTGTMKALNKRAAAVKRGTRAALKVCRALIHQARLARWTRDA